MYARDPVSKAVINIEDGHYKAIVARRQEKIKNSQLEQEINIIRSELNDIKLLLQEVINGKNNG